MLSRNSSNIPAWQQFRTWKGLALEEEQVVILQLDHDDSSGKEPRYHQRNAINAAVEAIAKGQDRVLLVMATGAGKTYTAFQVVWRLWRAGQKKRILFLADRNALVDQAYGQRLPALRPAMAKLGASSGTIQRDGGAATYQRHRRIYEVYLGLYQAITGPEERQKLFREFSPGFFDRH